MIQKIVCLGDSLTGPKPGESYLDKYSKWPDLLQLGVDAVFGEDRVRVLNQGSAGDPSSRVLDALHERLIGHLPQVAIILIGANNYAGGVNRGDASDAFRIDLLQIVRRAQEAGARVLLLQYPKPRAANMEKVWVHADAGNPVVAEVAATTGAELVSLAPAFDMAARTQSLSALANSVDGIHLNPGGELIVARTVLGKLRALGWPTSWPASV